MKSFGDCWRAGTFFAVDIDFHSLFTHWIGRQENHTFFTLEMFKKHKNNFQPGNIFSEQLQFPSLLTLQKFCMVHDSFWDAYPFLFLVEKTSLNLIQFLCHNKKSRLEHMHFVKFEDDFGNITSSISFHCYDRSSLRFNAPQ